jgi:hypothetical protein
MGSGFAVNPKEEPKHVSDAQRNNSIPKSLKHGQKRKKKSR